DSPARKAVTNSLDRKKLLELLIQIDLGYQWRRSSQGGTQQNSSPPRLEDYLTRFPELGTTEQLSLQMIGEEYWARVRWGDHPNHEDYAVRFPHYGAKLRDALLRIDAELAAECSGKRGRAPNSASPLSALVPTESIRQVGSVADFVTILQGSQLLSPAQMNEVAGGFLVRFSNARALAGELLNRGWLTPYQINQLLLGKAGSFTFGPYVILERL